MSLQSDILNAFKKQAAKRAETDTPETAQTELSTDLAAAISTNAVVPPIFVNITAVDFGVLLTAGVTLRGFVVPADWVGKKILQYWCLCPSGGGDVMISLNRNGINTNLMNITGNTVVSTGANIPLTTGDLIRFNVTINSSGLNGLFVTCKIG